MVEIYEANSLTVTEKSMKLKFNKGEEKKFRKLCSWNNQTISNWEQEYLVEKDLIRELVEITISYCLPPDLCGKKFFLSSCDFTKVRYYKTHILTTFYLFHLISLKLLRMKMNYVVASKTFRNRSSENIWWRNSVYLMPLTSILTPQRFINKINIIVESL